MSYEELCAKVLKIDSAIRFAGVANNKSELVTKVSREGVENYLNPDEVKMSIHYTLERWEKTSNLSHKIGTEQSSVIEYEKVTLITIPFNKKELFLISADPGADYSEIVNETKKSLSEFSP